MNRYVSILLCAVCWRTSLFTEWGRWPPSRPLIDAQVASYLELRQRCCNNALSKILLHWWQYCSHSHGPTCRPTPETPHNGIVLSNDIHEPAQQMMIRISLRANKALSVPTPPPPSPNPYPPLSRSSWKFLTYTSQKLCGQKFSHLS
jgi:hypothetical protein